MRRCVLWREGRGKSSGSLLRSRISVRCFRCRSKSRYGRLMPPVASPHGSRYAVRSDFWLLVKLSISGATRAYTRSIAGQMVLAVLWIAIGECAAVVSFQSAWVWGLLLVPLAFVCALGIILFVTVLILVARRLMAPDTVIILSKDNSAVLDVIKRRDHVTIANHTKLSGTSSAAALRTATGEWLPTFTHLPLRFRAQNEYVAKLYLRQFPQLNQTSRRSCLRGVELEL